MTVPVILDGLDWKAFAQVAWDRQPVLIRGVAPSPFVEPEVFDCVVQAQQAEFRGMRAPTVNFTVERTLQADSQGLLPTGADGSFDRYQERLAAQLDGRRYALVVSGFHAFDFALWDRERRFFAGLWDEVGLPLTGAITTLFHGTYEHSPVGVHKDRFATFMVGLRGRKRMRFWPSRPWREPVSSVVDYRRYLPESFAVEVEPGDLLYWPSDYYHVGESCGDAAATSVNVGVPRDEHKVEYEVEDLLVDLDPASLVDPTARLAVLGNAITAPARSPWPSEDVLAAELPPALAEALQSYRDHSLGDRLTTVSLRRWTAGGFEPVPPPAPLRPFTDADVVRGDTRFPIEYADGLLAANGHTITGDLHGTTIDRLRQGRPVQVADLPAEARTVLQVLESIGAITRC